MVSDTQSENFNFTMKICFTKKCIFAIQGLFWSETLDLVRQKNAHIAWGKIHWILIKYIYSQVSNTDPSGTHFMDLSLTTKWSGHVMMNSRMSTHRWYFVQSSGSLIRMGLGTDLGHSLRSSVGTKNNVKHIRIFPVIVNSWICLSILLVKWMNEPAMETANKELFTFEKKNPR